MNERLLEFDLFRFIAIVMVVLGHSIFRINDVTPSMYSNFFVGATGLFVFISGYFFHKIYLKKFENDKNYLRVFYFTKIKFVFVPFLSVSIVSFIVLFSFRFLILGQELNSVIDSFSYVFEHMYVLYPHWYVPFIMVIFLCSPLILKYIKLNISIRYALALILCCISLFYHRPFSNSDLIHNLIYFTPFYLLGICLSLDYEFYRKHVITVFLISISVFLFVYLYSTFIDHHIGIYTKISIDFLSIDYQFVQKISMCYIFVFGFYFFRGRLQKNMKLLSFLANSSFAVFFLHGLFTAPLIKLFQYLYEQTTFGFMPYFGVFSSLVIGIFAYVISLAIAVIVKKLFKEKARMLIGY